MNKNNVAKINWYCIFTGLFLSGYRWINFQVKRIINLLPEYQGHPYRQFNFFQVIGLGRHQIRFGF